MNQNNLAVVEEYGEDSRYLKYKKADFEEAIKGSGGKKSAIARIVGCARKTLYSYLDRYPELNDLIVEELREYKDSLYDLAMSNIMKLVLEGDPATSRWVVDRLGAEYGFVPQEGLADPKAEQSYSMTVNIITDDSKITDAHE